MAILSILDMPSNFDNIEYLRNNHPYNDKLEQVFIIPDVLVLKFIFDILKILTFVAGILFTFKWTKKPKLTFFALLLLVITFLYFDLPIHRCYNGNLETYWELGQHFH